MSPAHYIQSMPRLKRPITDGSRDAKSAAKRQMGIRQPKVATPKPNARTLVKVPMVPLVFTDIPSVTKELSGNGSYRTVIDEEALFALAQTHASYAQMATVLNISETVFEDPHYKAIIEEARAGTLINLRASQFKAAIEDRNATMLIWLGKQYLQQKDIVQTQQLDEKGNPINLMQGPTFFAIMPPNGRDLDKSRQLPAGEVVSVTTKDDAGPSTP